MTGNGDVRLRVAVPDVWDTVSLTLPATADVATVKSEALARALGRRSDPDAYLVKYRGAAVLDESRTLRDLGIASGAPLIVLPRHRRPVR